MALTTTQQGRTNVTGNRITANILAITDAASWPGGGEAFDATSYVANPESVHIESDSGVVFSYDRANKKIMAFVGQDPAHGGGAVVALQEATGLDLRAVPMRVMITGGRA